MQACSCEVDGVSGQILPNLYPITS